MFFSAEADPLITFIDLEASSLHVNSHPISVGWASSNGGFDYMIIEPHFHWHDWDQKAESIHKLSRESLFRDGVNLKVVANKLNSDLKGQKVFSDSFMDDTWLKKLFRFAELQMQFECYDIRQIANLQTKQLNSILKETRRSKNHNALGDARALLEAFENSYYRDIDPMNKDTDDLNNVTY